MLTSTVLHNGTNSLRARRCCVFRSHVHLLHHHLLAQLGFGEVMLVVVGGSFLIGRSELIYMARVGGNVLGWSARKLLAGRSLLHDASSDHRLGDFRRELEDGVGEIQQIQHELRAAGRISTLMTPAPPLGASSGEPGLPPVAPAGSPLASAAGAPVAHVAADARVASRAPPSNAQVAADYVHEAHQRGGTAGEVGVGNRRSGSDWMAEMMRERERIVVLAEAMPDIMSPMGNAPKSQ